MGLRQRHDSPGTGGTAPESLRRRLPVKNTIEVEVSDVADAALVVAIEEAVHRRFSHLVGTWYVRLSAVDPSGRWDLRIRGAFGHHVTGFLAGPDFLVEGVERRLLSFLRSVVPPLSVRRTSAALLIRSYESAPSSPADRVA
jgi:hypothetical protein